MNPKHLLNVVLFAAILALSALTAEAQCTQWDVSGKWVLVQGDTTWINLEIQQNGTTLIGNADYYYYDSRNRQQRSFGSLDGTIVGSRFSIQVFWKGTSVGVYTGNVGSQGRIEGVTYDRQRPSTQATWFSRSTMRCKAQSQAQGGGSGLPKLTGPPPGAITAPKPVKNTGKQKIPDATESKPPPTPPYILANPPVVRMEPFQVNGKTVLVWDAGPDHPYAEVWLSLNGADETRVLEMGKGALEVILQAGLRYRYILTDSGKTLATVELQAIP